MEKHEFTEKQAIDVIRSMILQSQKKYGKGADQFIVWGWFIVAASLLHYFNIKMHWDLSAAYIWIPAVGIPFLIAVFKGLKAEREKQNTSLVEHYLFGLWLGSSGISMVVVLMGLEYGWIMIYPLFIALFAWGTCTTGVILKFRPLVIGGVAAFVLSILAVYVTTSEILLLMAVAVTITYIIPGYLLKNQKG